MVHSQKNRRKLLPSKGRIKQVDKILFDEDARREYLTGFHKRKVEKKEAEKKAAIAKQKRIRRETRAENRKTLAERARENMRLVESAYGRVSDGSDSEESRSASGHFDPIEYEGEEQTATVTVVEDIDIIDMASGGPTLENPKNIGDKNLPRPNVSHKATAKEPLSNPSVKRKKKRKDFHYSTKAERLQERAKQLSKRKRGDEVKPKKNDRRRWVK